MSDILFTLNQTRGKFSTDNKQLVDDIINEFTIPNPASKFSRYAPSTLSAVTLFGSFLPGLTFPIIKKIKELYPNENIKISKELKQIIRPLNISSDIQQPKNKNYKYRDYQLKAIINSLKYGRGISLLPTAAGKSLIVYGIIENLLKNKTIKNSIILVPNLQLVTQMRDDLIDYGFNENQISTFSSFSPDFEKDKQVTITNRQWLEKFSPKEINRRTVKLKKLREKRNKFNNILLSDFSRFINDKKNENSCKKYLKLLNEQNKTFEQVYKQFLKDIDNQIENNKNRIQNIKKYQNDIYSFDCLIVDEAHQLICKNLICNYVKKINTNIIFGLTGTLPENLIEQWNVIGLIGPVLHSEKVYDLQDQNYIANVDIIPIRFEHTYTPSFVDYSLRDENPSEYEDQLKKAFYNEWNYIESVKKSNLKICQLANKLKGNTIILFDHTTHGKTLYSNVTSDLKYFINGDIDLVIRDQIKVKMENNNGVVLVGNVKAIGTGISIKNIDNIIFAISGKGATKIIQAIGRGLRLLEGKTKVNLFDIHHNFYYSEKHFEMRKQLYLKFYDIIVDNYRVIVI